MKKLMLTFAVVCSAIIFAFAQTITVNISGLVTDDVSGDPISNHPVFINSYDTTNNFPYSNTV